MKIEFWGVKFVLVAVAVAVEAVAEEQLATPQLPTHRRWHSCPLLEQM